MTKNIISILIKQHEILEKEINSAVKMSSSENFKPNQLLKRLKIFRDDLNEHMKLENNYFYVELLKKMRKRKLNTINTEKFIAEMDVLAKAIYSFLDKFRTIEKIQKNLTKLKKEIMEIRDDLILRIETEEAGVFSYWELFK